MDDVAPGREIEAYIFEGAEFAGAVVVVVCDVDACFVDGVDVVGGADLRVPNGAEMGGGGGADGVLKEFDLRASRG